MQTVVDLEKVYQLNPGIKKDAVRNVLKWAEEQPHLPKITELQVIHFLHSCNNETETAKNRIDNFFTVRTHCPEMFTKRDPNSANVQHTLNMSVYSVLSKSTVQGYKVFYSKVTDSDPSKYIYSEVLKMLDMTYMLWLHRSVELPEGVLMVIDMDGAVFGHLGRVDVMTAKKFFYYLQEAWPIRLKGIHFVNVISFMDKIMSLLKTFMSNELIEMVHLHAQCSDLYKFVPKECLPKECGGDAESIQELCESMKQSTIVNAEFFKEEEKQVVVESKRPGKPKTAEDLFGVEHTFKNMNID